MKLDDVIQQLEALREIYGGDILVAVNPTGVPWPVSEVKYFDDGIYAGGGSYDPIASEGILID